MGQLLADVVEETYLDKGVMLLALVPYVDNNRPGGGFYHLATNMGLLDKKASAEETEAFWYSQINKVNETYKKPCRR